MRHFLTLLLLGLCFVAYGQYPNSPNKIALGRQTTGDGLVFRGGDSITYNPTTAMNAWFYFDTVEYKLFVYNAGSWRLLADTTAAGSANLSFIPGTGTITLQSSTGTDVRFKAGSNITMVAAGDSLIINSTGGGTLDGEVKGDLSDTRVDTVQRIVFDVSHALADSVGKLAYNSGDYTLHFGMGLGNTVYQMGQELYYPPVINKSGVDIKNGQAVMIDTSLLVQGDKMRILPATGNMSNSNFILGVATHDIANNAEGFVTWFGYVREVAHANIAQTGITLDVGDILYISSTEAGRYTDVEPAAPNLNSTIALVVRKPNANNMTLLVRPWLNEKIEDLTDVETKDAVNGSVLMYDSSSKVWNATTSPGLLLSDTATIATKWYAADTASGVKDWVIAQGYNTGTVTSIATGYGLDGGTITTSGTLSVDTSEIATPYFVTSQGYLTTEVDGSVTNELQNLTLSGQALGISSGSGVTLPIVDVSAGTGISVSKTSGNATITNSAPDQTVVLTGSGIVTTSGTYPNFTVTGTEVDGSVTNELQNLTLSGQALGISSGSGVTLPIIDVSAGTGISVSKVSGNATITNSAPDQTVSITAGTGISTSGTYPNFTVTNNAPEATTARNISATGEGVFKAEVGNELQFKNLIAGSNISLISTDSTITITGASDAGGTVTSIATGYGLDGGTITTTGTLSVDTSEVATPYDVSLKQDLLSGTGLVKSTSGTISYITDNSANWDAAYNDRITSAAFTGTDTKTLTLTQQDAGTVTASFTDLQGVTSIATNNGITGGTITSSGTIGLTGQALALHNLSTNGLISRTGAGTVAGRTITAGTGISVTNGNGVSGNPTITNSAPDQTVVLTAGTGIGTSGTYPNFTITNSAPDQTVSITGAGINAVTGTYPTFTITATEVDGSVTNEGILGVGAGSGTTAVITSNTSGATGVTVSAGTGIGISETTSSNGGTITVTNNSPDQTVSITGAGINSVTGTYPNFTITGTELDGSTTNELQTLSAATNQITLSNSGGSVTIAGAGINTVGTAGSIITVTGTEVDGSTTNELQNLTLSGQSLGISSGSGVTLPIIDVSAGTGISVSKVSGNATITNSAPDQTVSIAAGTGISTSGTYPNFTITNNAPEATTARNVNATGEGIYRAEVSNELQFKKLVAGSNVTLTSADSTITIASTAAGTVTGSGTANRAAIWDSATNLTAGSNIYYDLSNGRVGINRTSLAYDFDLFPGSGFNAMRLNGGNSGTAGGVQLNFTNGTTAIGIIGNSSAVLGTAYNQNFAIQTLADLVLYTGGTGERMRINNVGSVGIGTNNPQRRLHVEGELRVSDLTTDTPTQIVGADADGDFGAITVGFGLTFSSGSINAIDGLTTNEGTLGVGAGDANTSVITSNTSGATGVTIAAGTGVGISESTSSNGGTITITNSAPDQTVSLTGAGINAVTGTYPNFTITGTEVDGSVSNEGTLGVGAGGANTSVITSNTSGATGVTIAGGTNITVTESTSSNGGTITIDGAAAPTGYILQTAGKTDGYSSFTTQNSFVNFTDTLNFLVVDMKNIGGQNIYTEYSTNKTSVVAEIDIKTIYNDNGTLSSARTVSTNGNKLTITGSNSDAGLEVVNTNTSGSTSAIKAVAGGLPLQAIRNTSSVGSLIPSLDLQVATSGTAAAGLGNFIGFNIENASGTMSDVGRVGYKLSNAAAASLASEAFITVRKNASELTEGLTVLSTGQLQLKEYGDTTFTGTAVKYLAVDDDGKVIEVDGAAGTVTSIATNNGITGGTITTSGTIGLTGQALALHNLSSNGLIARTSSGNVSARTITAGTGISISNGGGVSGNPTITNSAPDQTVVLTAGTGISTSGTYPNFTITNNAPEATTARNVNATGEGVYRAKVGNELQFKKLVAGSNITLTSADSTITIAGSGGTIKGTGAANKVAIWASADSLIQNTNLHWDNTNGRLGVNNTSPSERIHVGGNVRAERLIVNTFGSQIASLNNFAPTGSLGFNLWIGNGGQNSSYTSGLDGSGNLSIGGGALLNNTTGSSNTAVGGSALLQNTVGFANLAIGAAALSSNTEGAYNIAIGSNTLQYGSGANLSGNIAIGQASLQSLNNIYGNIGIGQAAFLSKTNGEDDIAIGRFGGWFSNAVFDSTTITSGGSNTYIGSYVLSGGQNRQNQIVIGALTKGQGSNTAIIGNSSITNTYLRGKVSVNTTASANTLDVEGGAAIGATYSGTNTAPTNGLLVEGETYIGKTTDGGAYKLQVAGAILTDSITISHSTQTAKISNFYPTGANGNNLFIANNGGAALNAIGSFSSNNIGIGFNTLNKLTDGSGNVVIGSNAGEEMTQTYNNTAIGFEALKNASSGQQNTAIGHIALASITTGSYNVAIGGGANNGTTSATNNTTIGWDALGSIVSGNNNVAIGYRAGRYSNGGNNLATNGTSIFIGSDARSASTSATNEIIIGYQGRGKGSNTTMIGNSSTTGVYLMGEAVITKKTPITLTAATPSIDGSNNERVAYVICNRAASMTITLPAAATYPGRELTIKTIQAQTVISASSNVVPIDDSTAGTAILPATDGAWALLVSDGTNWIIMQKG